MALVPTALPTLYEYYRGNGIQAGLSDRQKHFTLNNKEITIYSGAFHYFRVPRAHWRDRLRQMKAAGLNAVETYVPWNLHEFEEGHFDFGNGGSEFQDFLHLEEFLKTAQEEDLFALVRSGPYINSEWDFGGMPSWIIRKSTSVRNSGDKYFLSFVKAFFNVLMPILANLQFQKGGPIIALQIENEYGSTKRDDQTYLQALRKMIIDHGIIELLYTCDPPRNGKHGAIPDVLQTANFAGDPKTMLDMLVEMQPNKPRMAMESYTGWFDHWMDNHHHGAPSAYKTQLENILGYPASVNMYMFVGSTSFGFMSAASMSSHNNNSGLLPDTTSYDYDAPISEHGATSKKYEFIKEVINAHNKVKTKIPNPPVLKPLVKYADLRPEGQLLISNVVDRFGTKIASKDVIPMEKLDINHNSGQSFGYIVYRKTNLHISAHSVLKISGYVRDTVLVLINGQLVSPPPKNESDVNGFGFWRLHDSTLTLSNIALEGATLDLVVENFGRNTLGAIIPKGLTDPVYLNNVKITDWQIVPLEFKKSWNNALNGWHPVNGRDKVSALYKFKLNIEDEPSDTYLDMRDWKKGITIVNGFVLGRYFFVGPQQALYLPGPFLRRGDNDIIVFEHYNAPSILKFSEDQIFGGPTHD
nr:beta-galactosidase-1-like protein 2 [Leptinotarsa decemlineata]